MIRYSFEEGSRGQLGAMPIISPGMTRLTAPPVVEAGRSSPPCKLSLSSKKHRTDHVGLSCRKTPIVGYSGFVPGYTSECQNYGKVWRDVMVNNETRKVHGVKVRVLLFDQFVLRRGSQICSILSGMGRRAFQYDLSTCH
jgi:hypothetical protein